MFFQIPWPDAGLGAFFSIPNSLEGRRPRRPRAFFRVRRHRNGSRAARPPEVSQIPWPDAGLGAFFSVPNSLEGRRPRRILFCSKFLGGTPASASAGILTAFDVIETARGPLALQMFLKFLGRDAGLGAFFSVPNFLEGRRLGVHGHSSAFDVIETARGPLALQMFLKFLGRDAGLGAFFSVPNSLKGRRPRRPRAFFRVRRHRNGSRAARPPDVSQIPWPGRRPRRILFCSKFPEGTPASASAGILPRSMPYTSPCKATPLRLFSRHDFTGRPH